MKKKLQDKLSSYPNYEREEKIIRANKILDGRYLECEKGHKKPVEKDNICEYCYRHLEYRTPITNEKYKKNQFLPDLIRPFDAELKREDARREIKLQEISDYSLGIEKILELMEEEKLK